MFDPKELEDNAEEALDLKEDLYQELSKIGPITSVTIYDLEPEGVVSVKFQSKEHALECIARNDGRYFGGRQLEAFQHDGSVRYKKTKKGDEDESKENERLEKFGEWLEKEA